MSYELMQEADKIGRYLRQKDDMGKTYLCQVSKVTDDFPSFPIRLVQGATEFHPCRVLSKEDWEFDMWLLAAYSEPVIYPDKNGVFILHQRSEKYA